MRTSYKERIANNEPSHVAIENAWKISSSRY